MNEFDFWVFLFSLTWFLAGIYLVVLLLKATRTKHWPSRQGEIIHLRFPVFNKMFWLVDVRYSYTVEDASYTSTQISNLDILLAWNPFHWLFFTSLKESTGVTVYYNPNNPSESVLIPGLSLLYLPFVFFAAFVVVTGGWLTILHGPWNLIG